MKAYDNKGDFSSTGYFASNHSAHPPFRAKTFVYPAAKSFRASLALVPSLGQSQYKTSVLSLGCCSAHDLKSLGFPLVAPLILKSESCQFLLKRTSKTTTSGWSRMLLSSSFVIFGISLDITGQIRNKLNKTKHRVIVNALDRLPIMLISPHL